MSRGQFKQLPDLVGFRFAPDVLKIQQFAKCFFMPARTKKARAKNHGLSIADREMSRNRQKNCRRFLGLFFKGF